MNQELEIEFKNLLTKDEYCRLLHVFSVRDEQPVLQENFYFDTPDFSLKHLGMALRIREKEGIFTLTLKQPVKRGLLETHQPLTNTEAKLMLSGETMKSGEIATILSTFSVDPTEIIFFGSLETKRVEINYKNGLLVLDANSYLNMEDYEIEYEVTDEIEGQANFLDFLQSNQIPIRKTENKIRRFYNRKKQIQVGDSYED